MRLLSLITDPKNVARQRRILCDLASFKAFAVGALVVFHVAGAQGASAFRQKSWSSAHHLMVDILGGSALWILIGVILEWMRDHPLDGELADNPLCWTRASTAGAATFTLILLSLLIPAIIHSNPFTLLLLALSGVLAATMGIAIHLMIFWMGDSVRVSTIEALKAEQQIWVAIFGGAVAWTGLFISGVFVIIALSTFNRGLRDALPAVTDSALRRVLLLHGVAAGYAIAGTILWLLRPIHFRLEQIVDSIGALGTRGECQG